VPWGQRGWVWLLLDLLLDHNRTVCSKGSFPVVSTAWELSTSCARGAGERWHEQDAMTTRSRYRVGARLGNLRYLA
jgi:hypothetical protein